MLLELTGDYMRFLNTESLTVKKTLLKEMNSLIKSMGMQPSKKVVKEIYQRTFARQLELVIAADPKKPEKLAETKAFDLMSHNE